MFIFHGALGNHRVLKAVIALSLAVSQQALNTAFHQMHLHCSASRGCVHVNLCVYVYVIQSHTVRGILIRPVSQSIIQPKLNHIVP